MDIEKLIGEGTEYDKKELLRGSETKKLAEKCQCFCKWCWRGADFWGF